MSNYIAVVKYDKMQENGSIKRVSEQYLCNGLSVTEAEAVVNENLSPYITGDFLTTSVKESKIAEVVNADSADRFYLAKVAFVTIDEKTANEKKNVSQWLIGGTDFNDAYEMLLREINKCMADVEIISLAESPVRECFPHKS